MNLSAPFIHRPVATTLMAFAFLLVGIVAYNSLPVAALPNVDFPTLQISTSLPGASPETMASNVATPLERQFSLIPGIYQMTSVSALGSTSITVQFNLGENLTDDFEQVQAAINAASAQLPTNLPAQPTIRKVNPADSPIMIIALTSDSLPLSQVDNFADVILSQQISRIDGVGLVNIGGQQKPAMRIRLDPRKVAARGLQIDNVRAAIVAATTNAPKGNIIGPHKGAAIYANDQILDVTPWQNLVVGYQNGAPIRIKDIGTAADSVEDDTIGAWVYPGKGNTDPTLTAPSKCVMLIIYKSPGANVISTVDQINAALPQLQASVPPALQIHILMDRTQTIRASVSDVKLTLLITIILVVLVIYLFLRNVRATIIPSTVIPLALLSAMAAMLALNFSLDNLSLMALTIAVGFVVDDAIVMEEVIWQRLEHGEKPFEAALAGAGEVAFTVLSISISLVAVFTPLMFMGGVVGLLMREFAITLSAAVMLSLVLTLTLTPMLCSRFLKPPTPPSNAFTKALERGFTHIETSYARTLDSVLRHKFVTLMVFLGTIALAVVLYATAHTGFFPQQDNGFLQGTLITSQDASYIKTTQKLKQVAAVIAQNPDVSGFGVFLGSSSVNQASLSIALKPRDERTRTADQVVGDLRKPLAQLVGVQTFLQARQDINIGGRFGQAQYQYTLSDSNLDELNAWAPKMLAGMLTLPGLRDVSSDQQSQAGAINLTIDRDAAGRFGITPAAIDSAIYDQLGQAEVTQYFTQQNSYHVVVETLPELQTTADFFKSIYILSPLTGKTVPLSLFVKVDPNATSSLSVSHQGEYPAVTLSFNLAPGVSLSQATDAVGAIRDRLGAPQTLVGSFQGTAQAFQQSLADEPVLIAAALIAVYVILGVLYESFIHPLTILSTLPSAGVGALLALKIAGQDLNVIGIIAIILLIGIVKKNGIMIVDVALRLEREHGLEPEEAARQASHQRLRPILMTTACAALGGIPMILMNGTGSEFRQPLGWAIVGGLFVSQVLTLYTTPVIYYYLDRISRSLSGEGRGREPEAQPAPAE